MSQNFTSWQDYQSLVQLGAALNFAYAALDGILSDVSNVATRERRRLIAKIPKTVPDNFAKGKVRAVTFRKKRNCLDAILCLFCIHRKVNPYASLLSGVAAIGLLLYVSEHGSDRIFDGGRYLALGVSFGWFGLSVIGLSLLRIRLSWSLIPFFRGVA